MRRYAKDVFEETKRKINTRSWNHYARTCVIRKDNRMQAMIHYRWWLLNFYWRWKLKFGNNTLKPLRPQQVGSVMEGTS